MSENQPTVVRAMEAAEIARQGHSLCWHCRSEIGGEPYCPACVKIQPLGHAADYYSVMGLPRRLRLDPRVLEPVFHALSRRFHPDVYRMASGRERVIALENSALLNQAYRALRDPFARAAYLVQLEQGHAAAGKDAPPNELFEEILEVQELLADLKLAEDGERASLRERLSTKRDALQSAQDRLAAHLTGPLFERWDLLQDEVPADAAARQRVLDAMRRVLGERAYLRRVLNSLNEALAGE